MLEVSNLYFKQNKQLLYYEGSALYSHLKSLEHLKGVVYQNPSEWSLLKVPQRAETCSKSTGKNTGTTSVNVIRVSL